MGSPDTTARVPTIIVEHLDPELEDWQSLEYKCIAAECSAEQWNFLLSGLPSAKETQRQLGLPASNLTEESVESLYSTPQQRRKVCLLDPKGHQDLSPADRENFDVFLFGGILGDDPPRDRTGDLRKMGFEGRRLGAEQMTTDTAARVTRLVVQEQKHLGDIPFIDRPDIKLPTTVSEDAPNTDETVSMPFKYVRSPDGAPVMPKGMLELLALDADKNILDLL